MPLLRGLTGLSLAALVLACPACVGNGDLTIAPAPKSRPAPPEPPPAPLPSGRLPDTARPLRYELALVLDPKRDRFNGNVTIEVDVPRPTQNIVLHGRGLSILRAEVASGGQTVTAEASSRPAANGKGGPEELVLTLARPISFGRAEIRIAYSAPYGEGLTGFYRLRDGEDDYVFSQLEPSDARRTFPCFDEPGFKVPLRLKITTPKGNLAVANAREESRTDADDGRSTTFTFAPTAPLPTYLIALAVGPLELREGPKGSVPIRLVTTKGKAALGTLALETTRAMVDELGAYFDRPYPYDKLDIVAIPDFVFGAMENAGLISFREERVLVDEKSATTDDRRLLAETIGHEVSHHWFGNLVTVAWWDDLWLNEGFATWMESAITDAQHPEFGSQLRRYGIKNEVMRVDGLDSARPVRRPVTSTSEAEEAFDGIVYDKGAAVIGMLERWIGPTQFRAGVRSYIKSHEHGTAQSKDLFAALDLAAGKDVASVASSFLDQPGVPLVTAKLVCEPKASPRVELAQSRHRGRVSTEAERTDTLWKIPVCVRFEGGAAPACTLLDARFGELTLPAKSCPAWIHPNADEAGYYRSKLSPEGNKALLRGARALSVPERVGLVANAWALVQSGDGSAEQLPALLTELVRDKDPLVVEEVIGVLGELSDTLVSDADRPKFKRFVSELLLPLGKELGWDARRGESSDKKVLRARVLRALAILAESRTLLAEADRRARKLLAAPRSVDPETAEIALLLSTRNAPAARIAELVALIASAKAADVRLPAVRALGAFADPALLRRALDQMLEEPVKVQDAYYLFDAAMEWPASRAVVLVWVKERFPELRARLPGHILSHFASALPHTCDGRLADELGPFFREAFANIEGAERPLVQALEATTACVDLRAREGAKLAKKLP